MVNFLTRNSRKIVVVMLVIGLLAAAAYAFYQFVMQPRITVTSVPGSVITAVDIASGRTVATRTASSERTEIPLDSGTYSITVDDGKHAWLMLTTTSLFHNQKLAYTAPMKLTAATVVRHVGYNVSVNSTSISFLNTSKQAIENIDPNGTVSELDSSRAPASIDENSPGTAQGLHAISNNRAITLSNNILYVLNNGKLTQLNMNGLQTNISQIFMATSPTQDSFAVVVNQTLFWYASPAAAPQKVLDFSKRVDHIAYGGTKVLAYSTRMPLAQQDIRYAYGQYTVDPIMIDIPSKSQRAFASGPIVDATISPDGRYATIEPLGLPYTSLYDIAQNKALYNIPNPSVMRPVWTDGTHVLYGKGATVWNMNVVAKTGTALGTLPNGNQATSVTFSGNNTYYVTSYSSEAAAAIYRLSNTPADANAERAAVLDVALQDTSAFTLSYTNITRPTLKVTTNVVSNNPTVAEFNLGTLQARQTALDYLKSRGVDTNKLTIIYDPATL